MADPLAAPPGRRASLLTNASAAGLAPFLGVPAAKRSQSRDGDDEEEDAGEMNRSEKPEEGDEDDENTSAEGGEDDAEGDPDENPDGDHLRRSKKGKKGKRARQEGDDGEDGDEEEDAEEDDEDGERERAAAAAATREPKARCRAVLAVTRQIRAAAERRARAKERRRIAAILRHPAAERNLALATHLAFATRVPAKSARAMLDTAPAGAGAGRLDARMTGYGYRPGPSARPAPSGPAALADSWAQAAKTAGIPVR